MTARFSWNQGNPRVHRPRLRQKQTARSLRHSNPQFLISLLRWAFVQFPDCFKRGPSKIGGMKTISVMVVVLALAGVPSVYSQPKTAPPFQVVETTIDDVHAAMTSGKLSAHDLVQAYLDRINAFDKKGPALNCIITVNARALEECIDPVQ